MTNLELKAEKSIEENTIIRLTNDAPKVTDEKIEESINYESLTANEQQAVEEYVNQMTEFSHMEALQFGSGIQMKIAKFSDALLEDIETNEIESAGEILLSLVKEIKSFHEQIDDQRHARLFQTRLGKKSIRNRIVHLYHKIEENIDKIEKKMKEQRIQMLKNTQILETLKQNNLEYLKEITLYIVAGNKKLARLNEELAQQKMYLSQTKDLVNSQKIQDLENVIQRLEKRIYDLKTTRVICLQMNPQMRLLQSSNNEMIERIQSTLTNTIPLWKNEISIALGFNRMNEELEQQKDFASLTKRTLKQESKTLKKETKALKKQTLQEDFDIEKLQQTNDTILKTLDELIVLGEIGHEKKKKAEEALSGYEVELQDVPEIKI